MNKRACGYPNRKPALVCDPARQESRTNEYRNQTLRHDPFSDPETNILIGEIGLGGRGVTVDIVDIVAGKEPEDLAELNPYNTRPTLADRDWRSMKLMSSWNISTSASTSPLLPVYPVQRALAVVDLTGRKNGARV